MMEICLHPVIHKKAEEFEYGEAQNNKTGIYQSFLNRIVGDSLCFGHAIMCQRSKKAQFCVFYDR